MKLGEVKKKFKNKHGSVPDLYTYIKFKVYMVLFDILIEVLSSDSGKQHSFLSDPGHERTEQRI